MQVKETRNNPRPGDGTPGPGRPKGVPNKTTALLKDAILKAGEIAGGGEPDGLVNYLVAQAKQNPGPCSTAKTAIYPDRLRHFLPLSSVSQRPERTEGWA